MLGVSPRVSDYAHKAAKVSDGDLTVLTSLGVNAAATTRAPRGGPGFRRDRHPPARGPDVELRRREVAAAPGRGRVRGAVQAGGAGRHTGRVAASGWL